jgi:hypothetical protein
MNKPTPEIKDIKSLPICWVAHTPKENWLERRHVLSVGTVNEAAPHLVIAENGVASWWKHITFEDPNTAKYHPASVLGYLEGNLTDFHTNQDVAELIICYREISKIKLAALSDETPSPMLEGFINSWKSKMSYIEAKLLKQVLKLN